jgi:hypothetical protein
MLKAGCDPAGARALLAAHHGSIRLALTAAATAADATVVTRR